MCLCTEKEINGGNILWGWRVTQYFWVKKYYFVTDYIHLNSYITTWGNALQMPSLPPSPQHLVDLELSATICLESYLLSHVFSLNLTYKLKTESFYWMICLLESETPRIWLPKISQVLCFIWCCYIFNLIWVRYHLWLFPGCIPSLGSSWTHSACSKSRWQPRLGKLL